VSAGVLTSVRSASLTCFSKVRRSVEGGQLSSSSRLCPHASTRQPAPRRELEFDPTALHSCGDEIYAISSLLLRSLVTSPTLDCPAATYVKDALPKVRRIALSFSCVFLREGPAERS
jgi:hypothetical protein